MRHVLTVFVLLLAMATLASAEMPRLISYQGFLGSDDGTPVTDGDHDFIFRLYDAAIDGTLLWTESQTVDVQEGYFDVWLGAVTTLDLVFDLPYWLEIEVDTELLGQRARMTGSPYAFRAAIADSVVGNAPGENMQLIFNDNGVLAGSEFYYNKADQTFEMLGNTNFTGQAFFNNITIFSALARCQSAFWVDGDSEFNGLATFFSNVDHWGNTRLLGSVETSPGYTFLQMAEHQQYGALYIHGGSAAGQVLTRDSSGYGSWQDPPQGTVPGTDQQVPFNDGGVLAGSDLYFEKSTPSFTFDAFTDFNQDVEHHANTRLLGPVETGPGTIFSAWAEHKQYGALYIHGGSAAGQVLTRDASGYGSWQDPPPASAPGSNMQVPYNDGGVLAGSEVYYDKANYTLGVGMPASPSYSLTTTNLYIGGGASRFGPPSHVFFQGGAYFEDIVEFNTRPDFPHGLNLFGSIFIDGGSAEGQVLTRDASGYGSWQDPAGHTLDELDARYVEENEPGSVSSDMIQNGMVGMDDMSNSFKSTYVQAVGSPTLLWDPLAFPGGECPIEIIGDPHTGVLDINCLYGDAHVRVFQDGEYEDFDNTPYSIALSGNRFYKFIVWPDNSGFDFYLILECNFDSGDDMLRGLCRAGTN